MTERIKKFFAEARLEFKHVNWPTREEAIRYTGVVIVISLGLSLFLGLFDYGFTEALKKVVLHN